MATPTTGPYGSPTLDDFNRAGTTSPPSGSWSGAFNTGNTHLALAGDSATVKASVAGFSDDYWNVATFGPDCEVWACVATLATSTDELFALYARGAGFPSSTTAYESSIAANALTTVSVARENSPASFPPLGNVTLPASFAVNDALAMAVFGSGSVITIEVWFWDDSAGTGWVKAGTITDNFSITAPGSQAPFKAAGRIALELQNTTALITAFGGGTVVATPPASFSPLQWMYRQGGTLRAKALNLIKLSLAVPQTTPALTTLTPTDTGTGVDVANKVATKSFADIGTGTDVATRVVTKPFADTGTGSEAVGKVATKSFSDTGSGADAANEVVTKSFADTGTGADVFKASVVKSFADTGTGTDVVGKVVTKNVADTGTGTEAVGTVATKNFSDAGTGTDNFKASVVKTFADAGTGSETVGKVSTKTVADVGTGTETVGTVVTKTIVDTGTGTDSAGKVATKVFADASTGTDSATLNTHEILQRADASTGSDQAAFKVTLGIVDTGTGTDATDIPGGSTPTGGGLGWLSQGNGKRPSRRGLRGRRQPARTLERTRVVQVSFEDHSLATESVMLRPSWAPPEPLYVSDVIDAADDLLTEVVDLLMAGVI